MRDDDDVRETPPAVVGAVAVGTAPLPFLAVYTVIFLIHGTFHPVQPPDVTSSKTGELIAGLIALAVFVMSTVSLLWFLNGRRRYLFVIVEVGILGTAIYFLTDTTNGGQVVSILLVLTSVLALALAFAPPAWQHIDRPTPPVVARVYGWRPGSGRRGARPAATSLAQSSEPTGAEPATLRRRRRSKDDAAASPR